MKKVFSKLTAAFLAVLMLVSAIPVIGASAAVVNNKFENAGLDIVSDKESTLAPGVTENQYIVYDKNGAQVKMFVATADMSVDSVKLFTSYKDMDPTNFGMSKLTEQVASFNKKAEAGDPYYQGTVVAGINASYYNMVNGQPTGIFVMNGVVGNPTESAGYFAVMKDGSVKIGVSGDYNSDKGNIQEALGIYIMLVKNGEICLSDAQQKDTAKYPRQTIGITADNKVVVMSADGNQAPASVGLTLMEQAQVMIDLGCVWAGHLDGGGSMTYGSKPEGSDNFVITNNPSDGSERSVSNGFIIVSTAVASYEFDHVTYDVESEYVTPGTSVEIAVSGASSTGNAADIPAELTYETVNGTYENGVFTAGGEIGVASVTAMYNGVAVGTVDINVVLPTEIAFAQPNMTVPYDKTVSFGIIATNGIYDVKVKESDFTLTLSNDEMGVVNGFSFSACTEASDIEAGTVTATLKADATVSAVANIAFGKGSEVIMDFESGALGNLAIGTGYLQYGPGGVNGGANGQNECGKLEIVTSETGKVHDGSYALAVEADFTQIYETGYHLLNLKNINITVPAKAQAIGAWLYIPEIEEITATWIRFCGTDAAGTSVNLNFWANAMMYGTEDEGWKYFTMDVSSVATDLKISHMQIYCSDRDQSATGYYFKDNASVNSRFTFYLDNITIDYSSAVDDREAPVFQSIKYTEVGMAEGAVLDGNTVTSNNISFFAYVADNTAKNNYTGINGDSAKAYIDGIEVEAAYTNGVISIADFVLADGVHTVKFEICDNMGNKTVRSRQIKVNAGSDKATLSLTPATPDATKLLIGSLYWMNLNASAIEKVESVTMALNLNSVSQWELDNIEVAYGFTASYEYDYVTNNALITINRTGDVELTGAQILAKLPIRTWESRLTEYYKYEDQTPEKLWTRKIIWPMDIKLSMDLGSVSFTDGTNGSFSMEDLAVITELYGNYAELNANGDYANKKSWHVHTAVAVDDKAATCTENGYTGRTFCSVCNSIVDFGTTIPATGHTYTETDGVVKCTCGKLFTGVYTDGKTYVDGVVVANGWTSDFSYYLDGVKLTGLQLIDGYYYDFGENGVCLNKARLDGFYYNADASTYMYFVAGELVTGEAVIYPEVYFFDANGYAVSGDVEIWGYTCTFSEKGAFVSSSDASVVDAGFAGTNINYVLLSDGTLKVGGEGVMGDYSSSGTFPAWIVKNEMKEITSIVIGNGITKIGKFGFYRNGYVRTVSFEENSSLKTIGWGAFGHNWRLESVTIPASVEVLEEYAFYECGALKSFDVEADSKLTTIKDYAFMHDIALKTVYIPDCTENFGINILAKANKDAVLNVVEGSLAQEYCEKYGYNVETRKGIVAPIAGGKVTDTINWEFYPDGTLSITGSGAMANYTNYNQQPWAAVRSKIEKIVIGKDITSVGNYTFCYTQKVTEIVFEEGSAIKSIGVLSFFNCPKVKEIVLPETVESISAYAFGDCFALETLYVPQGVTFIYFSAFTNSAKLVVNVAEGTYAEEFVIKNNVNYTVRDFVYTAIASGSCGENATWSFYENGELVISGSGAMTNYTNYNQQPWAAVRSKIKKITIGKGITSVGNYTFCYTQNVTEIVFEAGSAVKSIGVLSFFNCPKVKEIVLPETVTSISAYAFGDCFALETLYVPQGVTFIYFSAFTNSAKLVVNVAEGTYAEEFVIKHGVNYTTRAFVYMPIESGSCGENATWSFYENGELVISGSGAMTNYTSHKQQPWANLRSKIKKIIIGKDITSVGNYAFSYTQNVTEIVFEDGCQVKSIGVLSFFNCPKVKEIVLPETVTSISAYAFGDCFALETLYVPQGVNFILNTAFVNSAKLVLNVAAGSYAEQFAINNNINYKAR